MENIYSFAAVTLFAKRHWRVASFLLLAAILLLGLRLHAESYDFGRYHEDEYHTVHEGLNLLVNGQVDNFRAQEGVRWLVRAFYPYALVYMNTHMGGNVYIDGWSYPGHNYVAAHFVNAVSPPSVFSADPNLRDLFHALRQQYIILVFACVLLLLLFFFKEKQYVVAFGGALLLGINLDLLAEQKIMYIEPGMLSFLAVMLAAYCHYLYRGAVSRSGAVLFGFVGAYMVATKISLALFALLPVVLFFYLLHSKDAWRRIVLYAGSFAAFYLLVNFPAFISLGSFNLFLHDFSSNFWQYAAGSDSSVTVAPGVAHLGLIVYQLEGLLGYALYALPPLVLFALYYANANERMILVPLALLLSLSVASLAGQAVYLPRNMIPFYLPLAIIALLSLEVVIRARASVSSWKYAYGGAALLSVLWLGGIVSHAGGVAPYVSALLPDARGGFIAELQALDDGPKGEGAWYAIGFTDDFFTGSSFEKKIIARVGAPAVLHNANYPALESEFSSLPSGSVVLVNGIGNNKHLTHYILPKYFDRNIQVGGYYVFFEVR